MLKKTEVFTGNSLDLNPGIIEKGTDPIYFYGRDYKGNLMNLPLTRELLSKHMLIMGSIGTGKTNVFFQLIDQLSEKATDKDVFIIFDTKGEFRESFYRKGDIVISNDETATGPLGQNYWNIFNEIDSSSPEESILEIASTIFQDKIKNTSQQFFPMAARDIFSAILTHFYRSRDKIEVNNKLLRDFLDESSPDLIRRMIGQHRDFTNMISYISDDRSGQTQGVISELQQGVREVFLGNFKKEGDLSIRNLVRAKGGRRCFIEYDLAVGKVLSPIYTLLFDLAIKEALSRKKTEGNTYFIVDEFSLLPNLSHIDDGVNFGRSLGIKFIIGIQNIEQIYEIYKENRSKSLLSGFLTSICFKVNDASSKNYIQDLHGKNRKKEVFMSSIQNRGIVEEIRDAYVVENWDLANLRVGEAIINFPVGNPFIYRFNQVKP
ncbi:type IV secretory system conjugative DNA transfer family protein [Peptoniphilus catoniae]|uniref:type IV secretory system conjugative DNA transfer family protein n=1 Tax=Peptoniphilus catoniae TaxID=1660341 RepID=UPI0010FD7AB5|nr:type IV secretion system DNA-binding domain-containing protein [Peptoniphilus catoniae]